jgi:hypothetical protein
MNDTSLAFQHHVLAIAILSSTAASAIAFAVPRWRGKYDASRAFPQQCHLPGRTNLVGAGVGVARHPAAHFHRQWRGALPWQPRTALRFSSARRANWMLRVGPLITHQARFRMRHHQAAHARQICIAQQLHVNTGCTQLRGAA